MAATRTLVPVRASVARNFLRELANLSDDPKSVMRFARKFSGIFPKMSEELFEKELFEGSDIPLSVRLHLPWETIGEKGTPAWLRTIRNGISKIWQEQDIRTREWAVYRFIDAAIIQEIYSPYSHPVFWSGSEPLATMPPPTPFEQVFDYLRKNVHRMACCMSSVCPAPYFFNVRSSQKYCSEDCARPSQREFKRIWWIKNRMKRKRKTRSKRKNGP